MTTPSVEAVGREAPYYRGSSHFMEALDSLESGASLLYPS